METLRLVIFNPTFLELPAFLHPLSAVAPRLTRLELTVYRALGRGFEGPFREVASQLRCLVLDVRATLSLRELHSHGDTFSFDRFLPACTSLRTLDLRGITSSDLEFVVGLSSAPLALLSVGLRRLSRDKETRLTAELLTLLNKPCLSMLRRWRLYGMDDVSDEPLSAVRSSGQWAEACRARGTEPRGDERYFTGECSAELETLQRLTKTCTDFPFRPKTSLEEQRTRLAKR